MKINFIGNNKTLVAIPSYNTENEISLTIDSCLKQSKECDILIVDNCSKDKTHDISNEYEKKYKNIKVVKNPINLGRVENWNICLKYFYSSEHNYLKFLFTGDELNQNCIEETEKVFLTNKNISVIVWPYYFVHNDKYKSISKLPLVEGKYTCKDLIKKKIYPSRFSGAIVCNTFHKDYLNNNLFDEHFHGMASFTNKLLLNGDLYYLDKILSTFNKKFRNNFYQEEKLILNIEKLYTSIQAIDLISKDITKMQSKTLKFKAIKSFIFFLITKKMPILKDLFKLIRKIYNFIKLKFFKR
jgi:glycosyltransferase involved in cell wall biosynthesis